MDLSTKNFIEDVCIWKKFNEQLFPDDVLNLLVQHKIASAEEIKQSWEDVQKKDVDLQLPLRYIETS